MVELEKMENEQKAAFLCKLQELGVDMGWHTTVLVALRPEFVLEKDIVAAGPSDQLPMLPLLKFRADTAYVDKEQNF